MHAVYANPRGQTFDGTCYLEVREKRGPSTYAGVLRLIGTRTASPGHLMADGSRTQDDNEDYPVTVTVQDSSITVQQSSFESECAMHFKLAGGTLTEHGVPCTSGGTRDTSLTKQP
jgi:hypothetical protein